MLRNLLTGSKKLQQTKASKSIWNGFENYSYISVAYEKHWCLGSPRALYAIRNHKPTVFVVPLCVCVWFRCAFVFGQHQVKTASISRSEYIHSVRSSDFDSLHLILQQNSKPKTQHEREKNWLFSNSQCNSDNHVSINEWRSSQNDAKQQYI